MVENRRSPETWRSVALWTVLLCVIGVAQFFARLSRGASFWDVFPWKTIALVALFLGFISWLSKRPLSPEVEEALRRYVEERSRCKRCATPRRTDDVFCSVCHPYWERGIVLVLALAMVGAVFLVSTLGRAR